MKHLRVLCGLALMLVLCSAFTPQKREAKPVYVFGVAASFRDTVVYCTEIQQLDSVVLTREGFMPKREDYSYQLKNYLEYEMKKPGYVCMFYFSENRAKLEKRVTKLLNRYQENEGKAIERLDSLDFTFTKPAE